MWFIQSENSNQADNKFISIGVNLYSMGIVLLFTVLGLGGCENVDKKSPRQVFHYNEDVSVTTLDPAFVKSQSEIWIVSQIYNGLVDLNADLQAIPSLAYRWELSNQNKTYTFHLRSDAQFCFVDKEGVVSHRQLKASDVVYSFTRIADPKTASPGAWIFSGKLDSNLNLAFQAPNDSTFVLNLLKPAASMLSLLATNFGYVVPVEFSGQDKSVLSRKPVGTGPFYLRRWEEEIKMVLRKNPRYHEKDTQGVNLPYLDAVNVTFVKNKQTAFMQFVAGSYDFFNGLEGSFKDELLTPQAQLKPKYAKKMGAIITPFLNTEYIGCYLGDSPNKTNWLQDVHLRKALLLSVDKNKLVRFFRNGLGVAGDQGFVPPQLNVQQFVSDERPSTEAWDMAVKEFQLSNYSREKVKPEIKLSTTADYLDMMVFLQETWGRLGIKVKVDIQTGGMLRQLRDEGQLELFRGSWIADYPDAENFLACFYQPFQSPNGPNYTHFQDATFDALYDQIESGAMSKIDRERKIAQANQILMDQVPVVPLYYDKSIRLIQPWVKGLENDAANRLVLKRVVLKR
jgi:ABC-type transport system substrate-binding protein